MWTFPFDYTDLRVRNARLPTFTSLESWNWRSRNSLLVQKGQRTALFLRLRSFSILRIFSLSFFFSYFFPIILYRVFFPRLWASFDTIIFLLLFPTRFILFYFFFYFNTRRSHYRSAHVLRTLCSSLFYYRNLV